MAKPAELRPVVPGDIPILGQLGRDRVIISINAKNEFELLHYDASGAAARPEPIRSEEIAMPDTIVEEVRKARDDYARQFNYDLHAMCADLRREQQLSGARVVSFPKRPARINPPNEEFERGPRLGATTAPKS